MHSVVLGFFNELLASRESVQAIANQIWNVLSNCDSISYNEKGVGYAYALLHFLDRFRRFQLTYELLDKKRLMPVNGTKIDILDIGTGPGPSMYALSDFYSEKKKKFSDLKFDIDYVERSTEFRNWLHHFTEFANSRNFISYPWLVPFHHGNFEEFKELEFNRREVSWGNNWKPITRIVKKRPNVIVFSNFLTTANQVYEFSDEIRDCMRYLRNRGILVVVGAKHESGKYREVYDAIDEIILNGNYGNHTFRATCENVTPSNNRLFYSYSDEYGKKLKELYRVFLAACKNFEGIEFGEKEKNILLNSSGDEYSKDIQWDVFVYRKKSAMRKRLTSQSTRTSLRSAGV